MTPFTTVLAASSVLATSALATRLPNVPRWPADTPQKYATVQNFVDPFLVDDGMPSHPLWAEGSAYGKKAYTVTTEGDQMQLSAPHFNHFEGKYWMYSTTEGCGGTRLNFNVNQVPPYPKPVKWAPGDYGDDENCGIITYVSEDFTNWSTAGLYAPSVAEFNASKAIVRYSRSSGKYVMFMGTGGNTATTPPVATAQADSPAGPWGNLQIFSPNNTGHDIDIAEGPDGTFYYGAHFGKDPADSGKLRDIRGAPASNNIQVAKLTPDLTGIDGEFTVIRNASELNGKGLSLEAISFFYNPDNQYWYILMGRVCGNCQGFTVYYYATDPMGPYTDGGYLSHNTCGGQNKGAQVVPTLNGHAVISGIHYYRSGPTDMTTMGYITHGDNQIAAGGTLFYELQFNDDGTIQPLQCEQSAQIPLAGNITTEPQAPEPLLMDCRVTDWRKVEVCYDPPMEASLVKMPLWQNTINLGPTAQGGPVMNGVLDVRFEMQDDSNQTFSWPASNVSWAPLIKTMDLGDSKMVSKISFSTNATNGCYGTMVKRKSDQSQTYGVNLFSYLTDSFNRWYADDQTELYVKSWK